MWVRPPPFTLGLFEKDTGPWENWQSAGLWTPRVLVRVQAGLLAGRGVKGTDHPCKVRCAGFDSPALHALRGADCWLSGVAHNHDHAGSIPVPAIGEGRTAGALLGLENLEALTGVWVRSPPPPPVWA